MPAKATDLIHAREAIERVLKQLDVDAYLFEIEPKAEQWELKVECAVDQGWGSFTLELNEPLPETENEQAALLDRCRSELASCKRVPKA
jgi:hypothetical protein